MLAATLSAEVRRDMAILVVTEEATKAELTESYRPVSAEEFLSSTELADDELVIFTLAALAELPEKLISDCVARNPNRVALIRGELAESLAAMKSCGITQLLRPDHLIDDISFSEKLNAELGKVKSDAPVFEVIKLLPEMIDGSVDQINNSYSIRPCIGGALSAFAEAHANEATDVEAILFQLDLVGQELITNSVYHGHGYNDEKQSQTPIELPDSKRVFTALCWSDDAVVYSVRDEAGLLTFDMIMHTLMTAMKQQQLLHRYGAGEEGLTEEIMEHGRGLDLLQQMATHTVFLLSPEKGTQSIIFLEKEPQEQGAYGALYCLLGSIY